MNDTLLWLAAGTALLIVVLVVVVMRSRAFPKPFPPWLTPILDSPLRRRIFSPELAAERHGIRDGMRVLEIGPGGGYFTAAARRRAGPTGMLICLDIQLPMLQKLRRTLGAETPPLVCASGSELPLRDSSMDLVFVCEVLGEIPDTQRALREFQRIIKPGGTLAVTEGLPDPHYIRPSRLKALALGSGFLPAERFGSWLNYTQRFTRAQ